MTENINSKKIFLYLLTCSIVLSALMGIWAILSGEFGALQGRVLLTTLTVVGTSILGLACGAFLESPRSRRSLLVFVPSAGIILAVLSAIIIFWFIWISGQSEIAFKTLCVASIFAFSCSHLSLLSLARLAKRFQWAIVATYAVVLALASIVSILVVVEARGDDYLVWRLIGVLAVTDAALTVMIPIFHRLSRTDFVDAAAEDAPSIDRIEAEIEKLKSQIARLEKQKEDLRFAATAEAQKAPEA